MHTSPEGPTRGPRRAGRIARVVSLALVVLVAAGCRTVVTVGVDVRDDGSGTVTVTALLDAAAAEQLGDPSTVALGDLRSAGWRVEEPAKVGDGLRFRATRAFASPDQLASVLGEVGGHDGVFRNVRLRVDGGFASTSYDFRSGVDLTGDLAQFGDADLTGLLGGLPLGRTPEELAASGASAAGAGTLVVSVRLPGDAPDTNGTVRDGRAEWRYPLTGATTTTSVMRSGSTSIDTRTVALVASGVALLLAAAVVAAVGLARGRRRAA